MMVNCILTAMMGKCMLIALWTIYINQRAHILQFSFTIKVITVACGLVLMLVLTVFMCKLSNHYTAHDTVKTITANMM